MNARQTEEGEPLETVGLGEFHFVLHRAEFNQQKQQLGGETNHLIKLDVNLYERLEMQGKRWRTLTLFCLFA